MATKKKETSNAKKKIEAMKNNGRISLHNLYDECNSHLRVLDFYRSELKYLQKRLADIANENTASDILAKVEQFQNQFIVTADNLDELKHTIKSQLKFIEKLIKQKPTHVDEKTISDAGKYSKGIHDAEKEFATLKLRFNKFLAAYL